MPEISFHSVTVDRPGQSGAMRRVLHDVSLDLPADFTGSLIGPSGAGKTTALRLMNRLLDATSGEVLVDGKPIAEHPIGPLRRRVAMVFNEAHLLGLSVADNLRLLVPDADDARLHECLKQAGLDDSFLPRSGEQLSAGERHRVALARALMAEPEMLLLDEVTSSLDPATARDIIGTLRRIREARGLAVVLAGHVFDHVRLLGGECVVMIDGRIVERGTTEQVFSDPQRAETRAFINGERSS